MKLLLTMLIVACLCGCQPSPQANDQPTLNFAIAQAPLNLDPRYATDAASERVNRLLYQRLVEFDAASQAIAGLADWQMLTPQHYRFRLKARPAYFHDGKPLSAADVEATYASLLRLKGAPHSAEFSHIKAMQIVDAHTLDFYLSLPDRHFAEKLIIGILPKHLITQGHDFSRKPIGSGALKFVSWQGKLVLQRLQDGQLIALTEVKDPTVRVLKLLRGEADILQGDLPPELVKYLQTQPEVKVSTGIGANFSYLGLNMQDPLLAQLNVRQALAHAIDRPAIIQSVMVANSRPASALLPPEHYAGNGQLAPYTYNPVLAKQLLTDAGVKLPLKLVYKTSTDTQRVRFATILQAQMQPAGIDLEIRSLDWGTFFADVKQGQFQLYGLTWVGIQTPEIYVKAFGADYFPPKGFNRGRYADAELNTLLVQENWPAATQRIHAQLPVIPLWYEGQFVAYRNSIQAYQPPADGHWDGLASVRFK